MRLLDKIKANCEYVLLFIVGCLSFFVYKATEDDRVVRMEAVEEIEEDEKEYVESENREDDKQTLLEISDEIDIEILE